MNWLLAVMAITAIPTWGAQNGVKPSEIAIYTRFSAPPSAGVVEAIENEVQSIMAPIGLSLHWLNLAEADGKQTSVELAVVSFKGRCDVDDLIPRDRNPGALGWTHMTDGVILPFADVDCSAVRSFMQKELLESGVKRRAQEFGRALGRVLAHELYHIFANTVRHSSDGVAREFYSVQDLMADNFQFQMRESLAILNRKAAAFGSESR